MVLHLKNMKIYVSYCLRKNDKCRFGYPKPIALKTVISITEIPYIDENIKTIRKIKE